MRTHMLHARLSVSQWYVGHRPAQLAVLKHHPQHHVRGHQ